MTPGSLIRTAPFPLPGLIWRELRAQVGDCHAIASEDGQTRITLPADLARAVPQRRSEYLAGRLAAALALGALGLPGEVGRNGRAPVWPPGAAGSITHLVEGDQIRAIAVASTRHRALGVDCEGLIISELATEVRDSVLSPLEVARRPATLTDTTFITLVFSAKEALYKALSPRLNRIPEFREAEALTLDRATIRLGFEGEIHDILWRLEPRACLTLAALPG